MRINKKLTALRQCLIMLVFLVVSCEKDESSPQASITEFSPASGVVGTAVVITGKNFSSDPAKNTVHFNGSKAEVSQASTTSLTVAVPNNATTGKISVSVHGKTVTSQADFVVLKPSITGFSPAEGIVGTMVTITGTDFNPVLTENLVKFNGIATEVHQASATSLTVTVPEGATTGKITITVYGETVSSEADFIVLEPSITGFSPAEGVVGTTVTITGMVFSPEPAENIVTFNGVTAEVTQASTTSLTVTVPDGATTGKISVTVHGKTLTSGTNFKVLNPSLSGFSPTEGVVGTSVTITGNDFSPTPAENIVKFNGVDAVVTKASTTSLQVTVPADATTGKISITVHGKTLTSGTDFTVFYPSLTGFSPTEGLVGASVTIIGNDFSPTPAENVVKFNGVNAEVTQASSTALTVTVPDGATTGKISVTVHGKTLTSGTNFKVLNPSLSGFSPTEGVVGTSVTITGNDFSPTPAENIVKFNGVDAVVTKASTTSLQVTVPADATTGKISITVHGKTLTSNTDFTVPEPSITTFFPNLGSAGISVRISGQNFSPVASQNTVTFNGTEAIVTSASPTELVATVPGEASTGKISVKVGPNTASSADDFSICNGSAELIPFNFKFLKIQHPNYTFEFDLINVGSEPIDLAKMAMQFYVSSDATYGEDDKPSGGLVISPGAVLASGETYHYSLGWSFSDLANYPYLVVKIQDKTNPVPECNKENNIIVAKPQ